MNHRWGIVLGLIVALSLSFQLWQLWRFVNAGPRFTTHDGQELCERVRRLESVSYGYRDGGGAPLSCRYEER